VSRQLTKGFVVAIALGGAVASSSFAWSNTAEPVGGRAYATRTEFDQAFADAAAASRPGNTPTNRERLRNVGWKRLIPPLASR
jgi:hypothetical protein